MKTEKRRIIYSMVASLALGTMAVNAGDIEQNLPAVADAFTVDANGAELMRVNGHGHVGIGTTTPEFLIDVKGGSMATNQYLVIKAWDGDSATYGTGSGLIWYNGTGGSTTNQDDALMISGPTGFTLQGGGAICSGTSNPKSKLHVRGLVEYADNAAALAASLTGGAFYRTGDVVKVVH